MGSLVVLFTTHLIGLDAMAESKMISAEEKQRQLCEAIASTQSPSTQRNFSTATAKSKADDAAKKPHKQPMQIESWVLGTEYWILNNKKAARFGAAQKRQGREGTKFG